MRVDLAAFRAALDRPSVQSSDFDLNPGIASSPKYPLRPAAVLVGLWDWQSETQLILTKRSSHLQHHPGQIAFPGGKVEAYDASIQAAALREAQEEIGLPPSMVQVLGILPNHETVTGFSVTPVLGHIAEDFKFMPEIGEVEEVFSVPFSHVLDLANFRIERRLWRGEWRRFYVLPYGPYYIWGATARILRGLAERLAT